MQTPKKDPKPGATAFRAAIRASVQIACLGLGTLLLGCGGGTSSATEVQRSSTSQSSASQPADEIPEVLATIGDEKITLADLRGRIGDDLDRMEIQYRRARQKAIETALEATLQERVIQAEATKQGKTVDQLVAGEAGGSLEPSEVEISTWYQENQARTGGRSLDQLRAQIAAYLRKERGTEATEKLQQRLNQDRKVTIHLEPFRLQFNNAGAPATGPENAPLTLVEFSDFECPFCGRFFPTIKRLEADYGKELRIVYRQFPLTSIHPSAFKAAEASLCAQEQGKFWEMHDLLFKEQQKISVRDLKEKAGRLGLSQTKFDGCLDSGRHIEQIQEDLKEGKRLGITGTPALFLNGIPIDGGAVPFETVVKAIEQEKARGKP